MLKVFVYIVTIFFVSQYDSVRGNPFSTQEQLVNINAQRNRKTFEPASNDEPRLHYSWSSWSLPSFSMNGLFKPDDDDLAILKKKIVALEESQKEILELLTQHTTASKTHCALPAEVIVAGNNGQTQMGKDETEGSKESDITNDKKGETAENTKEEPAQSVSATINGVAAFAVATNPDGEKLDEKKGTAPSKNDGVQVNASVNENEENKTTEEDGEKEGSTEKPKKVENSGAPEELTKPHFVHSMEENEQPGSPEKNTTEGNAQTVYQTHWENGIQQENLPENKTGGMRALL